MKCNFQFDTDEHDPIAAVLATADNWLVFGNLSFGPSFQLSESDRVMKFHSLIRDLAKRYTGTRSLERLGWFLRQEGNIRDKLFHFHFALTSDHIRAEGAHVAEFLTRQWQKIASTLSDIKPWQPGADGLLYMTKKPRYEVPESNYFTGAPCHWRMSQGLRRRLTELRSLPVVQSEKGPTALILPPDSGAGTATGVAFPVTDQQQRTRI